MDIKIYSKDITLNNKEDIKVIRIEVTNNSVVEESIKSIDLVDNTDKVLTNAKFFYKIDKELSKEENYKNLYWFLSENLELNILKPQETIYFNLEYHSTMIAISQIIENKNNQLLIPINILIITSNNNVFIKNTNIIVPS